MKPSVDLICNILKIGKATYYRYKKSDEPILKLINYLSKEELEELINTGKIDRLEGLENKSSIYKENDIFIDYAKIHLREKIQSYTDGSFFDWANKMIPKKYLHKILRDLSQDKLKFTADNSKESLLNRIKGLEVSIINKKNQKQLSDFIDIKLSKIECYILIHEHEEIMNYRGFWK